MPIALVPEDLAILAVLLMGVGVIILAKLGPNILINLLAQTTVLEIFDITMVELCAQAVGGHVVILLPKIAILTISVVMYMLVEDTIMSAVVEVVPLAVLGVLPRGVLM
jgi:hypothetical protein